MGSSKKGSQLTQLRSAINSQGLAQKPSSSSSSSSKKRKRDPSSSRLDPATRDSKLSTLRSQFNKFDVQVSKKKHPTFGEDNNKNKKVKYGPGERGKPEQSRSRGLELRRQELLPRIKAARAGRSEEGAGFVDRRWSEKEDTLSGGGLFGLERQRQLEEGNNSLKPKKKARFDLGNDDDDSGGGSGGLRLTHYGRSLDEWDSGGLELERDSGWGGKLGSGEFERFQRAKEMNGDDNDGQPKSKQEVMSSLITKSKFHKAERQKQKEEDIDIRMDLDKDFESIRGLLGPARGGGGGSMIAGGRPKKDVNSPGGSAKVIRIGNGGEEEESDSDESGSSDEDFEDEEEVSAEEEEEEEEEEDEEPAKKNVIEDKSPLGAAADSRDAGITLVNYASGGKDEVPSSTTTTTNKPDRELLNKLLASNDNDDQNTPDSEENEEEADDYDRYVKALAQQPRLARAGDRTKTQEEQVAARAEQLVRLEKDRRMRMLDGLGDDDEAEQEEKEGEKDWKLHKETADAVDGEVVGDSEDDEDEEEEASEEGDDDDDDVFGDLESEDEEKEEKTNLPITEQDLISRRSKPDKTKKGSNKDRLPFTFPCPSSHDGFLDILETAGVENDDERVLVIIERIRTLHHPRLKEGNADLLQSFLTVLIDHFIHLGTLGLPQNIIPGLLSHIFPLTASYPHTASEHLITKLGILQKNLNIGLSKSSPEAKTWPGLTELSIFRLIGLLFSTSDFGHALVTPSMLLMVTYLDQCRIRNFKDLASGCFLCSVILQYENEASKRIVPEVINFLANGIALLLPATQSGDSSTRFPGFFPMLDWNSSLLSLFKIKKTNSKTPRRPVPLSSLLNNNDDEDSSIQQIQIDLASVILVLIERFAQIWAHSEALIELVGPVHALLELAEEIPQMIQTDYSRCRDILSRLLTNSKKSRQPLRLQNHRPVPIPSYIPKFEADFQPGTHAFDPDSERAELNRLRGQHRKERKGAIRELRKDNKFMALEEANRRRETDDQYKKKIGRIVGGLDTERREEKDLAKQKEREKRAERKRSGRRR